MEYLKGCSTTIRYVVRKMAAMKGGLVCLEVTSPWGCISGWVDLHITSYNMHHAC